MNKLEHVRKPLRRIELISESFDPTVKPGISTPLERVAKPLRRIELYPLVAYDLILTLEDDADADDVFRVIDALLTELNVLSIKANGSPIEVDLKQPTPVEGKLKLRLLIAGTPPPALVERARELPTVQDAELQIAV